jgi:hypothetical protein
MKNSAIITEVSTNNILKKASFQTPFSIVQKVSLGSEAKSLLNRSLNN